MEREQRTFQSISSRSLTRADENGSGDLDISLGYRRLLKFRRSSWDRINPIQYPEIQPINVPNRVRRLDHWRTYTLDDIATISLLRREVATKINSSRQYIGCCFAADLNLQMAMSNSRHPSPLSSSPGNQEHLNTWPRGVVKSTCCVTLANKNLRFPILRTYVFWSCTTVDSLSLNPASRASLCVQIAHFLETRASGRLNPPSLNFRSMPIGRIRP